ncbi:MAG: nucleotidyltransferase domain-containing protein [Fuerstiella sp.]
MNVTEIPQLKSKVQQHPFPLLFATISGAHLYGFPSSDSDFDLRGAHVLPLNRVIGIHPGKETIDKTTVDAGMELDLVTHDVAKFFRMMLKKNGYVIEQVMSPLVVHSSADHEELISLVPACLTKHHIYHYLGFAKTQWELFLKTAAAPNTAGSNTAGPRIKPLLYVYRVLLTGIHLMQTGNVQCNLQTLNEIHQSSEITELLEIKRHGIEKQVVDQCDFSFHEKAVERLTEQLKVESERSFLPDVPSAGDAINDLLIRIRMNQFSTEYSAAQR